MVDKTTDMKLRIISLYRSNYGAHHHTREMAALVQKSHVTLLPHLQSLQKDKILTAKMVGKNKVYSLDFDNILAKKYLLLSETVETIRCLEEIFLIKKVATELFKLRLDGAVVLFGSYAKRTFKEDSDIDLFYLGQLKDGDIQEMKKIGKTYGKTVNIKKSTVKNFDAGLRKKDPLIIEIVKSHVLLQNPEPFIDALWGYYHEIG